MIVVELFTREGCGLCEEARDVLQAVQRDTPFELHEHDIAADPDLLARYHLEIPVVHVDGHRAFKYRLNADALRARLTRARRTRQMDTLTLQPTVSSRMQMLVLTLGFALAVAPIAEGVVEWLGGSIQAIPLELAGEPIDRLAEDFELEDLSGRSMRLSDFRGKIVFVNFWASWCPPCVEELPSILRLHQAVGGERFEVLAVSEDDTVDDVRRFFAGNIPPFPVLMDEGQQITRAWGTFKFPETYVVDAQGRIMAKFIGSREWDSPASLKYFRDLIGL